ncbi:hypothetical protein GF312_08645 [Candidatus Poribacteria bacterium]|nr:hypothetical protein [Candidatus Poribacteria bacterium]
MALSKKNNFSRRKTEKKLISMPKKKLPPRYVEKLISSVWSFLLQAFYKKLEAGMKNWFFRI